ncbi:MULTISPECIES: hypothetical protein [Thalassobaculum]|uniref:hypothetical protein n=1 Tax=Thalassobaculum TaxID=526215 RepID=UPI001B7F9D2F|nr:MULTISPECIES: hypothetical protein [Thalassobaculum]
MDGMAGFADADLVVRDVRLAAAGFFAAPEEFEADFVVAARAMGLPLFVAGAR